MPSTLDDERAVATPAEVGLNAARLSEGDAKARDPGEAKMLFEVVEPSKRDALAAIGGRDADIRYIAEAIGVGCLCYVVVLLDPAGSEANKHALSLGNQHRTAVLSPTFDPPVT